MSIVRVHSLGASPVPTSAVRVHSVSAVGSGTAVATSAVRVHSVGAAGAVAYQQFGPNNISRWDPASSSWKPVTTDNMSFWDPIAKVWRPMWQSAGVPPTVFVKPGPTNTGVPAGYPLTELHPTGSRLSVTTPGAVYEGLDIFGQVYVQAAGVIFRKCRFRGRDATGNEGLVQTTSAGSSVTVEDCTFRPDYPSYWLNAFLGAGITARRNDISRTVDGFGLYDTSRPGQDLRTTIESNWIHDLAYYSPDPNHANDNQTHNDGIQIQGGTGAIIRGNLIDSHFATDVGTDNRPRTTALSCILFNNNVGTTGGHVIEDNWFVGGYVPINGIGTPGVDLGRMWRNEFTPDPTGTPGNPPQTIQLANNTTACDFGRNTANANYFTDRTLAVLIRYSA